MGTKRGQQRPKTVQGQEDQQEVFITSSGREVTLVPVSAYVLQDIAASVEEEFCENGEQVDVPTYQITTVAGDVETHPLDAESLEAQDPAETERRKKAWADYQDCQRRMSNRQGTLTQDYMFREGVDGDPDSDEAWIRNQKRLSLKVPEDPDERKFVYVTRWLLRSVPDQLNAAERITILTARGGVNERKLQSAVKSFRNTLEERLQATAGSEN